MFISDKASKACRSFQSQLFPVLAFSMLEFFCKRILSEFFCHHLPPPFFQKAQTERMEDMYGMWLLLIVFPIMHICGKWCIELNFDIENFHLGRHRYAQVFFFFFSKLVDRKLQFSEARSSWASRRCSHLVWQECFPLSENKSMHASSGFAAHFQNVTSLLAEQRENMMMIFWIHREFRISHCWNTHSDTDTHTHTEEAVHLCRTACILFSLTPPPHPPTPRFQCLTDSRCNCIPISGTLTANWPTFKIWLALLKEV